MRAACFGASSTGVRRLLALVRNLPIDAASRAVDAVWTTEHELAARQVETTHEVGRTVMALVRMQADKNSRARIKIPDPLRLPRPWDRDRRRDDDADGDGDGEWPPRMRARSARDLVGGLFAPSKPR